MVFVLNPMVMMMTIAALRFMTLTTWANGIAPVDKQACSRQEGRRMSYCVMCFVCRVSS